MWLQRDSIHGTPRATSARGFALSFTFVAVVALVMPFQAAATTVTIPASKDNTLYESATGATSNGVGEHFFTGRTNNGFKRRAVIAFDIAAYIPAGSTIDSAALQLRVSRVSNNTQRTTTVHRLLGGWGEGTSNADQNEGQGAPSTTNDATWIHRFYPSTLWTTAGGDFNPTASGSTGVTGTGTYTWGSTAMALDVQAWLDTPASNFGWLIRGDESVIETSKRLDSRENGQTSSRPALIVVFTSGGGALGACCQPSGDCTLLTAAQCTGQGGTYQGDNTSCAPNPCPIVVSASLVAAKDNTLYESATGALSNGAGTKFLASKNSSGLLRRGVLQFDLSSIPPGSTIQSATLNLYNVEATNSASVALHRATASWGEGTSVATGNEDAGAASTAGDATWIHRFYSSTNWTTAGGDFTAIASATTSVTGAGWYTWSAAALTADVQAWVDNPATHFGWVVRGKETGPGNALKRFESRQSTDVTRRPSLDVTYIAAPPTPTGACCLTNGACDTLTAADCMTQGGSYQGDGMVCSSGLCPLVLEPFVDSLVAPPLAIPVSGTQGGVATYEMRIVEFKKKLHRDLPPTTVWGYDNLYPGPTIVATPGNPVTVNWINDLRDSTGALRTVHYFPVDLCMHGPDMEGAGARVVPHLHGGHVPPSVDGYPDSTFNPGESRTYVYPNNQDASLIWYHDHALGITRLNVMMGLAGGYVITDSVEAALNLPSGSYDVPLIIQDRSFNPDGSLMYPAAWEDHFFGDVAVVDGTVWPYMNVKKGAYRLRLLGGSNSRAWMLKMSNGAPFVVIGGDGGLLARPVVRDSLLLVPGERIDTIVDFTPYAAGTEIILQNSAPAPYPSGDPMHVLPEVMKFIVQAQPGYAFTPPPTLRTIERLQEANAVEHRDFILRKTANACTGQMWTINDLGFDDITEFPRLGSTEVWRFINRSGSTHPMHMHLVMFQVLDRTPISVVGDSIVFGTPTPPDSAVSGWKDTVPVHPDEAVRVIARFEDYTGRYPYHCHILEHEDHEMMRQFEVVADTSTAVSSAPPPGTVSLLPSQPNPAKDETRIHFYLPVRARARVEIFDVAGRRVAELMDRIVGPGRESVVWNGREERGSVASGVYLYRLSVEGYPSQYGKLTMMK